MFSKKQRKQQKLSKKQREYISLIQNSSDSLLVIVNDISKIEAEFKNRKNGGVLKVKVIDFGIGIPLKKALNNAYPSVKYSAISLRLSIQSIAMLCGRYS